ncbi:cytochrome-c peroxidase [Chitinophaga silvatica]|uniref:Methylamine utilization protein MauG n=1 Tax=Chitinophaga silvatica TaxID=2282649 RepID=A0A3E1YEX2_9BACT|nr:cytochrome c peroxidase [Chitinophaga silvatica]RFS25090.1 cytochrome-c peroxidase [Chitinophaga silvatica]
MKRTLSIFTILIAFFTGSSFLSETDPSYLRVLYQKPISEWPKPDIDSGIIWAEFKSLPGTDTSYFSLIAQPKVKLGKFLFFDPILSNSNQISCSSCHDPHNSWGDGRRVSLGTDHLEGTRNTPSLLNIGYRKSFFWDGKALTLEEQATFPIQAHHEMDMKSSQLGPKLSAIKAYKKLFKEAYGTEEITTQKIVHAIAEFQRTITSRKSRFDKFLDGDFKALTDQEIFGMHLFRTKARCMNCHNGQYLTDESFHNIGLTYYKRKYQDLGRYEITHNPNDVGRFKTPSLRDVMHNAPWMHNGLFNDITGIVNIYNSGMHMIDPTPEQAAKDSLFPFTDPILRKLNLTKDEIAAVVAFMDAISATQYKMSRPELPRD